VLVVLGQDDDLKAGRAKERREGTDERNAGGRKCWKMKRSGGVSLASTATNIIFCCDKKFCHVCRDKTLLLSRLKFSCRGNTFVATKLCLSQHTRQNCLSRQPFVATNTTKLCLSRQLFVVTNVLSRQNYVCLDKHSFVATKDVFCVCRDKHVFVATKLLSREKLYLWQLSPMIVGCLVKMETGEDRERVEG